MNRYWIATWALACVHCAGGSPRPPSPRQVGTPQGESSLERCVSTSGTPGAVSRIVHDIWLPNTPDLATPPLRSPTDLTAAEPREVRPVFPLEIERDGGVRLDGERGAWDAILPKAKDVHAKDPDALAVILSSTDIPYGRVVRALDLLKQGGFTKIALGVNVDELPTH